MTITMTVIDFSHIEYD